MNLKSNEKEKNYFSTRWNEAYLHYRQRAARLFLMEHLLHLVTAIGTLALLVLLTLPEAPRPLLMTVAGVCIAAAGGAYALRFGETARTAQSTAEALAREKALFESGVGVYADSASAFIRFVERSESLFGTGKLPGQDTPPAATSAPSPLSRFGQPARPAPSGPPVGTRPNPFTSTSSRPPIVPPIEREQRDDDVPGDLSFQDDEDEDDDDIDTAFSRQRSSSPFARSRPTDNPFTRGGGSPFGAGRGDLRSRLGGSDLRKGEERNADLANLQTGNGNEGVHFAANYPKEIREGRWQPLKVYAYLTTAAEAVAADIRNPNGAQTAILYKRSKPARQMIPEGAIVTATPHLKGFQFNPAQVSIGFYKDWHRFDIEMRAVEMRADEAANGFIDIMVDGILVADLPLSVYMSKGSVRETDVMRMIVRKPQRGLFAIYSPEDRQIEARLARVSEALGLYALRDAVQLRLGEDSQDERMKLLQQAGLFQMFWSHAAANSTDVTREWQQALHQFNGDVSAIRVVYWQQPMPPLPEPLRGATVLYQPELAL